MLTTSAPKSDSTVAAAGAAMKLAQSSTFSPSKMPFSSMSASLPSRLVSLAEIPLEEPFEPSWPGDATPGGVMGRCAVRLFPAREQSGVAACGRGIHGYRLFGGKPRQIMRPAGLRSGSRQPEPAERLHTDH